MTLRALVAFGLRVSLTGLLALPAQAQVSRTSPLTLPPTGGRYSHVVTTELPAGSRLVLMRGRWVQTRPGRW
jgi:hypothetical protein